MIGGPGLTGDRNFQNSCEVKFDGEDFRRIVYGKTREEIVAELDASLPEGWDQHVFVSKTKRIRMGLSPAWARVARRFNEYGDPE